MDPRRGSKRGPKFSLAENAEIIKTLTQYIRVSMIFKVPGAHFGYQNGVQNGVQNGSSTQEALESILEASWNALGAL